MHSFFFSCATLCQNWLFASWAQRGAKCKIDDLDLTDLELPNGGRLRIGLTAAPPESVKDLGELFEVVAGLVKLGTTTEGYLEIRDPQKDCPFLKALPKKKPL